MNLTQIGFYSAQIGSGVNHGYGYASVQLIEAWQRKNIPVWTWAIDAPIGFNFAQPNWYEIIPNRVNIGYTPWESTQIPSDWPYCMNQMDEIWTPSEANKQWFIDGGVKTPIRVLHHGINRNHWPRKKREIGNGPLRILAMGADAPRKGSRLTLEAFKAAFPTPRASGVELVIKGKPWWDYKRTRGVKLIDSYMSHKQLTNLYLSCHAMFYPCNGEGFGFIPFDSMATGMPTWVTNWSGPQDFIQFGYPLKVSKLVETNYWPHEGLWAEPDFDFLVESMRQFADSPTGYLEDAYEMSAYMDEDFSWDKIAEKSITWMEEILN